MFIHYEGKRAADIPASRYGIRHLVAKAVRHACPHLTGCADEDEQMEAEAIKRAEGTVPDDAAGGIDSIIAAYKTWGFQTSRINASQG